MRTRYILLILLLLAVGIAAFIIISTAPKPGAAAATTPTPVVRADETLRGESIGGRLYFERGGGLWRWQGGDATRIGGLNAGTSPIIGFVPSLTMPAVSADGTRLAYVRREESYSDVYVAGADGSGTKALTTNKGQGTVRSQQYMDTALWALSPVWSPDGTQIAYLSDNGTDAPALWLMGSNGGGARRLSSAGQGAGGVQRPVWSSKGIIAAAVFANNTDAIYSFNPKTGASSEFITGGNGVYDPAWSPDGTHIAYVQRRAGSSLADVWVADANGDNPVQVSKDVNARSPVWSPDGTQIAFLGVKDKDGYFDIYLTVGAKIEQKQVSHDAHLSGAGGLAWGS